jgi:hypothetical protein
LHPAFDHEKTPQFPALSGSRPAPPGKVDGFCGEFKAAERWVSAHPGETIESLIAKASAEVSNAQ